MSNWQQTCEQQRNRLEKTEVLANKLLTLCRKAQTHLPPEIMQAMHTERPRLERQLERLRANRFEVAVIGLEKAGKSALLNAWLGQEILPSEDRRCTYTTTEILSAATERDQHLLIEYYTREEIDNLLEGKEEDLQRLTPNSKEYKELKADIDETKESKAKLYDYAAKGRNKSPLPFADIAEITEDLYEAVAGRRYPDPENPDKILMDRSHPRAIKRIELKTTRLSGTGGIVFHDVPGFNSTVTKHREEAEKRMAECDAIIFAKKMDNFNLDLSETSVLSIADADHIKIEEKIFVVTTQCDKAGDREQYDKWLRDNQNEWGKVPSQRVVPVCAIAHLAKLGTCSEETQRLGSLSTNKLSAFGIDNGIETLKKAVDDYVDTERTLVLQKRCDAIVKVYKDQAQQVLNLLNPIYSQISDNDTTEEDLYGEDFGKWWGSEWAKIQQDFKNWGVANIDGRAGTDDYGKEHTKLTELRTAYNEGVKTLFANLQEAKKENMELTYKEAIKLVPVPARGNRAIRDKLHPEIQRILQTELPNQLTGSLKEITDEIVSKAKQSLYEIEDVERILLDTPAIVEQQIRHGFKTLFLRFGRVAADVFMVHPLHDRPRLLEEYEAEILTLEAFYEGNDKKTKGNLTDYLRAGLWIVKATSDIGIVPHLVGKGIHATEKLGSIKDIGKPNNANDPMGNAKSYNEPKNFPEVVKEIEGDLAALQDYLQNSVFCAAGFITYSKQELQQIRDRFIELEEKERRWDSIVRREAKRQNHNIPFKTHNRIEDFRLRREIALELKELTDYLI